MGDQDFALDDYIFVEHEKVEEPSQIFELEQCIRNERVERRKLEVFCKVLSNIQSYHEKHLSDLEEGVMKEMLEKQRFKQKLINDELIAKKKLKRILGYSTANNFLK